MLRAGVGGEREKELEQICVKSIVPLSASGCDLREGRGKRRRGRYKAPTTQPATFPSAFGEIKSAGREEKGGKRSWRSVVLYLSI